jgi:hypothetical protein
VNRRRRKFRFPENSLAQDRDNHSGTIAAPAETESPSITAQPNRTVASGQPQSTSAGIMRHAGRRRRVVEGADKTARMHAAR